MGVAQLREHLAGLAGLFALAVTSALLVTVDFVPRYRHYTSWSAADAVVLRYDPRARRTSAGTVGKGVDHFRLYSFDAGGSSHIAEGPDVSGTFSELDDIAPGSRVRVAYNPVNPAEALAWSDVVHVPYLAANCLVFTVVLGFFAACVITFSRRRY